MRRILMVAYHFPPLAGSSGIQRTLRFVQHLPPLGWQPLVLTAHPRAYERTNVDLLADVPDATVVRRAFALDTTRHLTLKGRYMAWMARPDRWVSWRFDGIRQGLKLIERYKPEAIWSTYPIATAHMIGAALHRRTGLPWIADFRDPMAQEGYPSDPVTWRSFQRIEETALKLARLSVFTTPGAAAIYRERYPEAESRIAVVENGYDEESFEGAQTLRVSVPTTQGCVTLLHSGIVYPSERDPTQLFQAINRLVTQGLLQKGEMRIRFRASMHDELLLSLAAQYGLQDFIELAPAIGYRDALAEMLAADALLVMQASNCNAQIPAKIYEYLRAGRPIIALTDPQGDTAGALRAAGIDAQARLDSVDEIQSLLPTFLRQVRAGHAGLASPGAVQRASRRARSEAFVQMLERAVQARAVAS